MTELIVTLDPGEMAVAQMVATLRRAVNQAAAIADRRRDPRDPMVSEMLGATAEIAFAKHFNVWPDLSVTPRRGGHDAILNGRTWDIKAVGNPEHRLLASPEKSLADADRYALAVVTGAEVELVGWAPAERLLDPSTVMDLGHGPVHVLGRDRLESFPETAQ